MSILITGGAGFIGRHTATWFHEAGIPVVLLDDLSSSRRQDAGAHTLVQGEIADAALLRSIFQQHTITGVVHLAARAHVGESMAAPALYFRNNLTGTLVLLEEMLRADVRRLVFASSCSVYGECASLRTQEHEALHPESPYGESKLAVERMLPWFARTHGMQWIALRYFNVAGAVAALGEDIRISRRIIPRALHAALTDSTRLGVFGTSFATPDGSAIRDYVHVADVAEANLRAWRFLEAGGSGEIVNIAGGVGASVLEILHAVEAATGRPVPHDLLPAQPGDPGRAVADVSRAESVLGWTPHRSSLHEIVTSLLTSVRCNAERDADRQLQTT